jgi:hypothetical protein
MKRRTWGSALAALLVTAWAATARAETIKIEISNLAFAPAYGFAPSVLISALADAHS